MSTRIKPFLVINIISFLFLMFPHGALSTPGDILYVQVNVANLREGDSLEQPVINWLKKGHKVIEIQQKEEWVEVIADLSAGQTGWIHSSIIGKEIVGDKSNDLGVDQFNDFKDAFIDLNRTAELTTGTNPFIKIDYLENGIVQIAAKDGWLKGQIDIKIFDTLLDEIKGSKFPIAIHVVDENGNRYLSIIR